MIDYQLSQETRFYRLYREGGNLASTYTLQNVDDISRYGPAWLKDRYAIPDQPNAVATVDVPTDTQMRVSTVADNQWGSGGGTQHIIQGDPPERWFTHSSRLTNELDS